MLVHPKANRVFAQISGFESGSIAVLDRASLQVTNSILMGSMGQMAISPDGSRLYVGAGSTINCGPYICIVSVGQVVSVIDTYDLAVAGFIPLNGLGPAAGIAVTPDRSDVYIVLSSFNKVGVASTSSNTLRLQIPVAAGANQITILTDPNATITPYLIDAVDDVAPKSSSGGTAVANVLANDRLGGFQARLTNVTLSQVSSTSFGDARADFFFEPGELTTLCTRFERSGIDWSYADKAQKMETSLLIWPRDNKFLWSQMAGNPTQISAWLISWIKDWGQASGSQKRSRWKNEEASLKFAARGLTEKTKK